MGKCREANHLRNFSKSAQCEAAQQAWLMQQLSRCAIVRKTCPPPGLVVGMRRSCLQHLLAPQLTARRFQTQRGTAAAMRRLCSTIYNPQIVECNTYRSFQVYQSLNTQDQSSRQKVPSFILTWPDRFRWMSSKTATCSRALEVSLLAW